MSLTEDIPTPENGFYVLITGANRYFSYPPASIDRSSDSIAAAWALVSEHA